MIEFCPPLMRRPIADIIAGYQRNASLAEASTIPAEWYTDPRVLDLERRTVFSRAWQVAGRIDQLRRPGQYVACETAAGEPIVLVRGSDDELRGFFNVCRHHAAAVMTAPEGSATHLRCPYHGWTYSLEGELKGTPDFTGVCDFDRAANGLVPVDTDVWENWVFVRLEREGPSLARFLGAGPDRPVRRTRAEQPALDGAALVLVGLQLESLRRQLSRRRVSRAAPAQRARQRPRLQHYTIENGERFCLQSSPMVGDGAETQTGAVRTG